MIGGSDFEINGLTTRSDLDCFVRTIRLYWPKAIIETESLSEPKSIADPDIYPVSWMDAFFVYSSLAAFESWDEFGRTDKNADHLLYAIIEADAICITIDDATSKTAQYVKEIETALKYNRRFIFQPLRDAA